MWKLRLINYRHLLCFRTLSSMTSANLQKSTKSLDLCHSSRWQKSKELPVTAIMCNHLDCQCNQPTAHSTKQTCSQASNHHARVYGSHTYTLGHMLNVQHTRHAQMLKVDFKYQPYSLILMKSCRCHTRGPMLEIIQCAFASVHSVGSHT